MNAKRRKAHSRCPRCTLERVSTIDSRQDGDWRRRRRKCDACGHRWSTVEVSIEVAERFEGALTALDEVIAAMASLRRSVQDAQGAAADFPRRVVDE